MSSACNITTYAPICQERDIISRQRRIIAHAPTGKFLLNSFSIHNYEHIAAAIPDAIKMPQPVVSNSIEVWENAVQQMRQRKSLAQAAAAGQNVDANPRSRASSRAPSRAPTPALPMSNIISEPISAPAPFDRQPVRRRNPQNIIYSQCLILNCYHRIVSLQLSHLPGP